MTHDTTPPKRIWADQDNLSWVEECPGEAMKDCEAPYILASDAEAMVAAALRGATQVAVEAAIDYWKETEKPVEQRKHGGKGLPACVAAEIEGLIPQPASAALDKLIAEAEARGMERAADIGQKIANAAREHGHSLRLGTKAQNDIMERCWGAEDAVQAIRAANGDQP